MVLIDIGSILQNVETIISIIFALLALGTTGYAIIQKIRAGNYREALTETEALLKQGASTIDQIKSKTEGMDARLLVKDALKEQGVILEGLGLKGKMDAKLHELGLGEGS